MPIPQCCFHPSALKTLDVIISCFFVFPAAILYWSGTWKFLELNIFPHHPYAALSLLLLIGLFVIITGYFVLPLLEDLVVLEDLQRDFAKHLAVSKVFNYVMATGHIFFWKGTWLFIEEAFGKGLQASIIIVGVSMILLLIMKSVSNAVTTPFVIHLDNRSDFYRANPRFRTQLTPDSVFPYSFDVLFTCLIIQPLTIGLWVGVWHTLDALLYADNRRLSYIVSGAAGLSGALIIFMLQTPARYLAKKLYERQHIMALLYTDVFHVIVVLLGILSWRGLWGYIDDFVLTSYDDIWLMGVFHGLGMVLLLCSQTSRTAATLQCGVDDEVIDCNTPVDLNVQFLSYFCRYHQRVYTLQVGPVDESQSLLFTSQYEPTPVYGGF